MKFSKLWQLLFLTLFLCVSLGPSSASSQTPPPTTAPAARIQGMTLHADELMRDHEKDLVELKGNVQIVRGDQHISCDRALIYLRSKKVELIGQVRVAAMNQTLVGDEVLLDYETGTGLIRNGYVKSGQILFEGEVIQKTGEEEFYIADANYTSCTNCPSTWAFSGQQIRAEMGGYAYIKNSIMRIGGVPVLWLPYLIVPLKSERQSGLLTPTFGSTRDGGLEGALPYFWAIDRSQDMTFTYKQFEKRHSMGMVNYRYMLDENSEGELDTHFIRDRVFPRIRRFNHFHPETQNFNRWYLYYDHSLDLGDGWTHNMTLHNVSDLQYMRDFEKETSERNLSDPALENRVSFTRNFSPYLFTFDSSYYINLLRADPLSNNNDSVHRLPELTLTQTSQRILDTPFLFSWELRYTNFARNFQSYDDLNPVTRYPINETELGGSPGNPLKDSPICDNFRDCEYLYDGTYNNRDLIRTGQRFKFQPTINANFRVAEALDISPKITYREMRYFFPVGDDRDISRRYLKTELGSKLTFSRVYGNERDPKENRYKHVIEPEVVYSNIPWQHLEEHPFFPRQSTVAPSIGSATPVSDGDLIGDLGVQFDEEDRILDRNLVTFNLTNRLIQRFWGGNANQYRQVVRFKLSQSYNLTSEATRNNQNRWSDLAGQLTVRFDNIETNTTFNYFPDQNVTNIKTRTALINDKGQFFEVGLDRAYTIVQGQPTQSKNRIEDVSLGLGFISGPMNFVGQVVYDANWKNTLNQNKIKSWGYVAQLKPPGECWQVNITHGQRVGGDARIDFGFEYNFDGVPKPPPPRSTLDQFRTN